MGLALLLASGDLGQQPEQAKPSKDVAARSEECREGRTTHTSKHLGSELECRAFWNENDRTISVEVAAKGMYNIMIPL